ncbi:hypothetical protein [Mangrovicella endophytica]|uniref:hypothetical protein n=1 Tax=Mangrovicella endophytica TaxID=2066697 RepID=UPI000C9DDAD9|nr:hypothetical protein [Mangrovicella endophytica]
MVRSAVMSVFILAASGLPGHAQTPDLSAPEPAVAGTAEGALQLRDALASYLTSTPFEQKLLRIEPDPAGHRITLDPAAALSALAGSPVKFAPLSFIVSERADGSWNVFTKDPIDVAASGVIEGQTQSFSYKQGSQAFKGVYSPALAAFLSASSRSEKTETQSHDALSGSIATIRATTVEMTAKAGANGGTDINARQTYEGVKQTTTVTIPQEDTGTDPTSFGFEASAGFIDTTLTARDARTAAMRDFYLMVMRYLPQLQADATLPASGPLMAQFKDGLGDLLPLWSTLEGNILARDVGITSLYGGLKFAEARQVVRFTGVDRNASFDLDFALNGIRIDSALVPAWSATLLPDVIEIGYTVSGVDLLTPAEIALREIDFAKEPPLSEAAQARISAAFQPERIRNRLKPSRIVSKDFDVALSGDFSFTEAKPHASIKVDMAGLDKTVATLQSAAAANPDLYQAITMLQFVKGMGRPTDGGRIEWLVDVAADGSVSVNGTTVKGPDETLTPEEPDGDAPALDQPLDAPAGDDL